mgnify:CR=1 FL=1
MGPNLLPFSDSDEAETFAEDRGGQTPGYDDIDRSLVEGIQMAGMK